MLSGWWMLVVEPCPSEKYEFVSWGDEIPIYGSEMFQTTNQIMILRDIMGWSIDDSWIIHGFIWAQNCPSPRCWAIVWCVSRSIQFQQRPSAPWICAKGFGNQESSAWRLRGQRCKRPTEYGNPTTTYARGKQPGDPIVLLGCGSVWTWGINLNYAHDMCI